MKRSVSTARSGKLKSAHWSSQDDYRFGNQSPGKWQKKETKPVQLGKQNAKAVQPTLGPLPSHNCWLRISSWSLLLLTPLLIVSSLVRPTAYDIFMRSLSESASLPLFFFFFPLPLLSAQQSQGYSLLHGLFSKDCYLYIKSILQKPMLKIRVGKISFLHSFLKEPHPKTPVLSETDC